jgi:pimeloyl-ACP methyl ester carboxylesterase
LHDPRSRSHELRCRQRDLRKLRSSHPALRLRSNRPPGLRAIQVPTLVLWGRHDPYFPVPFAERQREIFPSARVVILEGSGHWPIVDDPAGVRAAFAPFLRDSLRDS